MKKLFALILAIFLLLNMAGCSEQQADADGTSLSPTASQEQEDTNEFNGEEIEEEDLVLIDGVYSSSVKISDIVAEETDTGLDVRFKLPKSWTVREGAEELSITSSEFTHSPALIVKRSKDMGIELSVLLEQYTDSIEENGGKNVSNDADLTIAQKPAGGILYSVTGEKSLEISRFLFQQNGYLYDFEFTCSTEQADAFYAYMEVILESIQF